MKGEPTSQTTLVMNSGAPIAWTVEAVNSDGDGGIDVTVFSGPLAEQRARDYIAWKYGITDPDVLLA